MNEVDRRFVAQHLSGFASFAAFVDGWLNEKNIWSWIHFKPQHYFICDANSRVRVDFVGRTETMDADFRHICEHLGVVAELNWMNRSNHGPYSEYYTDDLRKRVAAIYAKDIALFGYELDSQRAHSAANRN